MLEISSQPRVGMTLGGIHFSTNQMSTFWSNQGFVYFYCTFSKKIFNRLFVQVCHIIGFIFVNFMLIVYFQPIKQTFSNKFNVNSLFYIDFACFVHSKRLNLQVDQNLYILMLLYTHCFGVNSLELFFLPQKEGL